MRTINLVFKKLGNHWYPNLNHSNPTELILNPVLEKYIDSEYRIENNTRPVTIDSDFVNKKLDGVVQNQNLERYIL